MFGSSSVVLGLTLLFLGVLFLLFVFLFVRMTPRLQPISKTPVNPLAFPESASHNEAVLLIQSGGRVIYLNNQARELFNMWEETPNLERLARRAKPVEAFLNLCAQEGKAQFSINGRLVEGTSYFAPSSLRGIFTQFSPVDPRSEVNPKQYDAILVSIRRPAIVIGESSPEVLSRIDRKAITEIQPRLASAQSFSLFTELSQAMAASLDLDITLQTILESIVSVLPCDHLEIALWDADNQCLAPYRLHGLADQKRRLEKGANRRPADLGYSDYLITQRESLLVKDVNSSQTFRPSVGEHQFPFQSYLGAPLVAAGDLIGTLELASLTRGNYDQSDLEVLNFLSRQAGVALKNALLYKKERQQSLELALRANLAQAVGAFSDIQDLYARLIETISPLIQVDILGFLVYDENRHVLEGKTPFMGIPLKIVDSYAVAIEASTPAEAILQSSEPIVAANALHDPRLEALGLSHVILSARIQHTVLVPLNSSGRMIGYLQAANKHDGTAFDQEDLHLLEIIARQAAPIIDNSIQVGISHNRAQRAETLLRIIKELSVSLDLDQVLRKTLHVLREYVDAEQITILIARPDQKKLHRLASEGYTPKPANNGSPTPFNVDQGLAGWIISQRESALIDDVLQDERWIQVPYTPSAEEENGPSGAGSNKSSRKKSKVSHQHRSALGVPLISGAEILGCLLLFHREVGHFSANQLELVQAAASQVAVAVNNAELYRLIRDQADELGNLLRFQQIETSRSKAILEAVADGVLVTDARRKITLFNESAERILGLDHSKVLGKSMEDFAGLFGRTTHKWMEIIHNWSQDPTTYQSGDIYSEQIILENGHVVSIHLAPVSLGSDFLGSVSIFQDITHQVEVDRLKSEFVATVSHELRTPMTSIKGYVEILLMGAAGVLSDQQAHFLNVVKDNTERLTILVNDLLDISQIESGRVTLTLEPLNLEYIADLAIADLKRRKEGDEKSISVMKEVQPSLPRVLGDAERIQQVFDNLLENAYQYNTQNGQITIAIHRTDGTVQVDIKDTGIGIHPDDHERVFERFYRGENPLTSGIPGTGLGLSIVKNLIEMHNGRIWLNSSGVPGKGSTFSFTLPKKQSRRKGNN